MTVLITLTTAGTDSGPFNLYSNLDGYTSAFEVGVSKSALLAGYSSSSVPDFATIIRVKSTGDCVNYIDITLVGTTTTTTTTIAPTTTTTTTSPVGSGLVFINNFDTFGSIGDVQVNTISIFVTSGAFPVLGGENAIGNYGGAIPGLSTVGVFVSVATDAPINLTLSTGYTDCLITTGYVEFTGVDLSTNPNITITLQPQGSACL
jgi:hypothetical protein